MIKKKQVELKALEVQFIKVNIKGITPLLMEKMNMDVVEKYNQLKGKKKVTDIIKMEEEMVESKIHRDDNDNVAFPSIGFHKSMVEVAPYLEGLDKKKVRGSVRFTQQYVPITYEDYKINTTWGKTSGMTKAPRKIMRPEFVDWTCTLLISFNPATISAEQIIHLVNWAGFQIGLGGWRPEHGGTYGQFKVVN